MDLVDKIYNKNLFGLKLYRIEPYFFIFYIFIEGFFSFYLRNKLFELQGCERLLTGGFTCTKTVEEVMMSPSINIFSQLILIMGILFSIWFTIKCMLALIYGKLYWLSNIFFGWKPIILQGWFIRILGLIGIFVLPFVSLSLLFK